jgi:hypothetical protein
VLPLEEGNVRANVISGFQHPAVAIFYIVAMVLLCMHLYHGLWSMFQSLGISHPRYTPPAEEVGRGLRLVCGDRQYFNPGLGDGWLAAIEGSLWNWMPRFPQVRSRRCGTSTGST